MVFKKENDSTKVNYSYLKTIHKGVSKPDLSGFKSYNIGYQTKDKQTQHKNRHGAKSNNHNLTDESTEGMVLEKTQTKN